MIQCFLFSLTHSASPVRLALVLREVSSNFFISTWCPGLVPSTPMIFIAGCCVSGIKNCDSVPLVKNKVWDTRDKEGNTGRFAPAPAPPGISLSSVGCSVDINPHQRARVTRHSFRGKQETEVFPRRGGGTEKSSIKPGGQLGLRGVRRLHPQIMNAFLGRQLVCEMTMYVLAFRRKLRFSQLLFPHPSSPV